MNPIVLHVNVNGNDLPKKPLPKREIKVFKCKTKRKNNKTKIQNCKINTLCVHIAGQCNNIKLCVVVK